MTLREEDRAVLIGLKFTKARTALNDADFLMKGSRWCASVNRLYYAAFHVLSALALKENVDASKHQRLIGWFNRSYIKTGKVEVKFGDILHRLYDRRMTGDYDDDAQFQFEEVGSLYAEAGEFISRIEALVRT